MKCPKCQAENEPDAKFCNACGNKLRLSVLTAELAIGLEVPFARNVAKT